MTASKIVYALILYFGTVLAGYCLKHWLDKNGQFRHFWGLILLIAFVFSILYLFI